MNARIEKITPGPWVAPSAGVWTADGSMMVADLGSREVTKSRKRAGRIDVRADARLIAAAPELLKALLPFSTEYVADDAVCHAGITTKKKCGRCSRILAARAAIAKAVTP